MACSNCGPDEVIRGSAECIDRGLVQGFVESLKLSAAFDGETRESPPGFFPVGGGMVAEVFLKKPQPIGATEDLMRIGAQIESDKILTEASVR